ncbi:CidA/LrgA family protein [Alloiococcus sp. CFN-8]|uniref:CidA/LrgA family protein n=1 Tax=Alloiococcus sp. CFN-8 TaxID=3416081 RepID=UPI003CEECF45
MKYLRELLIIIGIYILGLIITEAFNLIIPGNIVGMIILLILLLTKGIDIKAIENTANFFLNHLAFFFIPAGVSLMNSLGIIKDNWIGILFVSIITTFIIFVVTGKTVEYIQKLKKRCPDEHSDK